MVEKAKILITGSSGMLGSDLCQVLAGKQEIFGLDLVKPKVPNITPISFIQCDITDRNQVLNAINRINPGLIIHTAAYADVDGSELSPNRAFAVNAGGTENIAQAAKKLGISLFYISTDYVFDGKKDKPYTETDLPNPINIYGQSKLEGERIIQALLDKYLILRSSWLFGLNGKNFVSTILQKAKENKVLKIVDDQIGCPTYTLDLANAIKDILSILRQAQDTSPKDAEQGRSARYSLLATNYGIYHITNSGSCSWYELTKKITSLKQLKMQILPIKSEESKCPVKRPKMCQLDNSKFKNTFKFSLRSWSEALNHFLLSAAH